jgi:hypothetical protein
VRRTAAATPCQLFICLQIKFLRKQTLPIESLLCHCERTPCNPIMSSQTGQGRTLTKINPEER